MYVKDDITCSIFLSTQKKALLNVLELKKQCDTKSDT